VFAVVGFLAVILGLVFAIAPNFLPHDRGQVAALVVVISIVAGSIRAWPRSIQARFSKPDMTVQVIEGDLFDQDTHLVIGMCDTFDTSTPVIISQRSIQGQFLDRVLDGNVAEFDRQLDEALERFPSCGTVEKEGKHVRYPVGTVATLGDADHRYFCVAYTEMDNRNVARGSVAIIQRSLESLWNAVCDHSNGGVVSTPIIGGGQARVSQVLSLQDSIRLTVLSFVLASRREKICDGLNVIFRPQDREKLDLLEIQAFLDSLT
jgi:hypothetical protein